VTWTRFVGSLRTWLTFAFCLGTWVVFRGWYSTDPQPLPLSLCGQWISSASTQSSVTEFRKHILLSGATRTAWIAVSADEGFDLLVNGSAVGHLAVWRTTHPYQTGLTELGQAVSVPTAAMNLNYPREYQWRGQENYRVPIFFDLSPLLQRGHNSICVVVESRGRARLALEGEVRLWSGEVIRLDSDTSYKASVTPPPDGTWTNATYSDLDWPSAVFADAPGGSLVRTLDPQVFAAPLEGQWLRAAQPTSQALWFETTWTLPGRPGEAWIRVLSDRSYQLFVNDMPVRVAQPRPWDLDASEWTVGMPDLMDLPEGSEPLDPHRVGELFAATQFEAPIAENPLEDLPIKPPSDLGGGLPLGRDVATAHAGPERTAALLETRELNAPKALLLPSRQSTWNAYGVANLLHPGKNAIAIRVTAPDPAARRPAWPPRLALDGQALESDGTRTRLESGASWFARAQTPDGVMSPPLPVVSEGAAEAPDVHLPRLQYRGTTEPTGELPGRLATSAAWVALIMVLLAQLPALERRLRGLPAAAASLGRETRFWMLVLPSTLLFGLLLVDLSWAERDDLLRLLQPAVWRWSALGAACVAIAVALVGEGRWDLRAYSPARLLREVPRDKVFPLLLFLLLLSSALLRAHNVNSQPWEDDELASAQAALAIADTGLPKYVDHVYYSRSPLYHYVVGASVCLFGHNIWALRLPSVAFGIATTWLIYLFGARLLKSRWTGFIAAALYAVHPYAIFVGHMVRFYQQQQFFCLLTLYFFCEGFIARHSPRARYLTLASFLAAFLSQELSLVLAVPLVVCYLLLARSDDRRSTMSLALAAACTAALVALDLALVLTVCQTALEAISPNSEATLAFHFANPTHLITIFLGYSRLHLALSAILLLALPWIWTSANRSARALVIVLVLGSVTVNLLVTLEALRYVYWLYPVWLLLGAYGIRVLLHAARSQGQEDGIAREWFAPVIAVMLLGAVVASWSPWKLAAAYDRNVLANLTAAFNYVRGELRPGDAVAATEPQPPASLIEIGKVDYDLSVPLLQDFVFRKDGKLIDRNAGAEVIATLEQLEEAIARHDRLWVVINRWKFRSQGQEIMWPYPAARIESFLRENFELKHESFQYAVYLWDSHIGRFRSFRGHGVPPI
jgi:4-amino-4-deoxy-L-arabinose transferase-like glycosyltransferase